MRKSVKIFTVVLGVVVGLVLLVSVLVSPVAKWFVEKHDVDIIGREVTMDNLKANIFNGKVEIEGFKASEENFKQQFLSFDTLAVQIKLLKLLKHEVELSYIHLTGLDGNVVMTDNGLNFMSIVRRFQKDKPKEDKKSKWTVKLYDIVLKQGALTYADVQRGSSWGVDGLRLNVPGLTFGKDTTKAGVAFNFIDGGRLVTDMKYHAENNRCSLSLDLDKVNVSMAMPFIKDVLTVDDLTGSLSGKVMLDGSLDNIKDLDISGSLTANALNATYLDHQPLLNVNQLKVDVNNVNPAKRKVDLEQVSVDGLNLTYELFKEDNTWNRLFKTQNDTVKESVDSTANNQPWVFGINHILLANSAVDFADHTRFSPFKYELTNIRANVSQFSLDGQNDVRLNAQLPKGGSLLAIWKGGLNIKHSDQHLQLIIKNLDMAAFAPYSEYFVGNKLENGVLSFVSDNSVKNGMLNGNNMVDIYNCEVGKKNKALKAEYANVPLKLGVALLKDLDGKIAFNIPVSGDINSPKFSYGKIVWHAIMNIMLKAVASPFVAIAKAAGANGEELKSVAVDAMQPGFTSKQYTNFAKIVDIVSNQPDAVLVLTQQYEFASTVQQMGVYNFKKQYYFQQNNKADGQLSLSDWEAIAQIKDSAPALITFTDNATKTKGKTMKQKVAMTFSQDTLQQQVAKLAAIRNMMLEDYLVNKMGLPKERVVVRSLPVDELKAYRGKCCYDVELQMPEDATLPIIEEEE